MHYHLCYHTFVGVLYYFQYATIPRSLPDVLLYASSNIFSETSTYLYHYRTLLSVFFKKKYSTVFFKKDGNA